MLLQRKSQRRGAVLVESAMVYPVVFLIMMAIVMLGVGVFRYQQVANISREASRYASVHGSKYATETGGTAAAPDDGLYTGGTNQSTSLYDNAIKPRAIGMDTSKVTYSVTWDTSNAQTHTVIGTDAAGQPAPVPRTNYVTVTVSYSWKTLFGTIPVSSTSKVAMQF